MTNFFSSRKAVIGMLGLGLCAGSAVYLLSQGDDGTRYPASSGFQLPSGYEDLSGCAKQDVLWRQIEATEYRGAKEWVEGKAPSVRPPFRPFGPKELRAMSKQAKAGQLLHKMALHSDIAPNGWVKYIHAVGSVAKVEWVPTEAGHAYSGLFKGARCGLIRLSLTYDPSPKWIGGDVAPGAALKLLVDGQASQNASFLTSLRPQGQDHNFFKSELTNIVPAWKTNPGAVWMHKIFNTVSQYAEEISVAGLASVTQDGKAVADVHSPRQIFLVSAEGVAGPSERHDVRADFQKLPSGSTLYHVKAVQGGELAAKLANSGYRDYKEENKAELLKDAVHIGDIVLRSGFVSSEFGDADLFFRHRRVEER